MKTIIIQFLLFFICASALAQANCMAPSTGFTPINDLSTGTFTNAWNAVWQGGLYPNGSNSLPSAHKAAAQSMIAQVMPRDANGNPDTATGKIVWLSIGMSNTTQESQMFIPLANAFSNKNPKLALVDGAQGGQSASVISAPWNSGYANFWNTVNSRLTTNGVTANQVQVIWFKEADQATKYTNVHDYYDSMVVMIPRIMNDIKVRFPNARLCYMASRSSARYASTALNPEPYSYYTGWAVKHIIEKQISGDPQLQFSGTGAKSPWLSWGIYMWSDGSTPQVTNPKVFWNCSDFVNDGTHPSSSGQSKVADLLLDFFSTDSTSTPWFLKPALQTTGLRETKEFGNSTVLFPNPGKDLLTLRLASSVNPGSSLQLDILDVLGKNIRSIKIEVRETQIPGQDLPAGIYYFKISENNQLISASKVLIQ